MKPFVRLRTIMLLVPAGLLTKTMVVVVATSADAATTLGASAAQTGRYFGAAVAANKLSDGNGINQQWSVAAASEGHVRLINRNSGKALEVQNVSTADGGNIAQFTDWGGNNQQ